jgi:hypothetical protein
MLFLPRGLLISPLLFQPWGKIITRDLWGICNFTRGIDKFFRAIPGITLVYSKYTGQKSSGSISREFG